MADLINHKQLAESRLATQYRESDNLIAYIKALLVEADTLESNFQKLLTERWIDSAVGFQLDVLGTIVGRPRTIEEIVSNPYFGFSGSIGGREFDSLGGGTNADNFRSLSDIEFESEVLDDETYRLFIRAKIEKNKTNASIEEVINVLSLIIDNVPFEITEQDTAFEVDFKGSLTDRQKLILTRTEYTPRPICVSVNYHDNEGLFT